MTSRFGPICFFLTIFRDTEERAELLSRFADLKTKETTLKKTLDELALSGPEAIARINKSADEAKEAANRWTG